MVYFFGLFQSRSSVRLLEYFLENPSKEVYVAQLSALSAKDLKLSRASLFKSLKELEAAETLVSRNVGRSKLYKLASTPLVKQLKILRSLSIIWPVLKKISESYSSSDKAGATGKGLEIYLYGSTARGENAEESDVDLLVVGKRDAELERKIVSNLKKAKIVFLTPMEYARLPRDDKAFYESVERDKIKLV